MRGYKARAGRAPQASVSTVTMLPDPHWTSPKLAMG
jgi:hypothetical protein